MKPIYHCIPKSLALQSSCSSVFFQTESNREKPHSDFLQISYSSSPGAIHELGGEEHPSQGLEFRLRQTKAYHEKECKICTRPFTVFRRRPGRDAWYKKTKICQTCSKLKNVCQVCLLDLEFGLPIKVHDAAALSINSNDAIPKSDVNREYFAEEHDRMVLGVLRIVQAAIVMLTIRTWLRENWMRPL